LQVNILSIILLAVIIAFLKRYGETKHFSTRQWHMLLIPVSDYPWLSDNNGRVGINRYTEMLQMLSVIKKTKVTYSINDLNVQYRVLNPAVCTTEWCRNANQLATSAKDTVWFTHCGFIMYGLLHLAVSHIYGRRFYWLNLFKM